MFGLGVNPTLCYFVLYSTRRFVLSLALCYFVLVFFSPFRIAFISLGEERANLSAFVCSICASFVLSVSSSSWSLGGAAACDCGTPWTFRLPFFLMFLKSVLLEDQFSKRNFEWYAANLSDKFNHIISNSNVKFSYHVFSSVLIVAAILDAQLNRF